MRRIVSETDEARLLGAALTKAYAQGMSDLASQATQRMLQIDDTTIEPFGNPTWATTSLW
jgi:ribulose kinase